MKTLSPDLQSHLNSGTTTLCWCWKIVRGDGATLGFTDHDAPVTFDGASYEAVSGFTASEVQSTLGLAVDNLTVMGALASDTINEADLAADVYDNASIEIWRVNWGAPEQRVLMRKVRGLAHILNQPVGRAYGYSCDADLGDARCTIDLSNPLYRGVGTVTATIDQRRFTVAGLDSFADQWFSGGKLTWSSGANETRAMEVKRHGVVNTRVSVELWQQMSEAIVVGDAFIVTAGCDKQFSTANRNSPMR